MRIRAYRYLSVLCAAAMIAACTTATNKQGQTATADSGQHVTERKAAHRTPVKFSGLLMLGDGMSELATCDQLHKYWIADSTGKLRQTRDALLKTLPYDGESIYAEVEGYLAGQADTGDASAYEDVLVVKRVLKTTIKNFKTACYPFEFIASGTEPFWSAEIIPAEQRIVLKDLATNSVQVFPYQPASVGGGVYRFETQTAEQKLVIIIRNEPCSDGMTDRKYNYTAEVILNGQTRTGCAIKKGERF